MIRCVFFDVDDTLVDYALVARKAFHAALGFEADYDNWLALDTYVRFDRGELDFETMRTTRMTDYLAGAGMNADAVELEARRFAALQESFTLFDDVRPCLTQLRDAGLLLGLITNNDGPHQRHKLSLVELSDSFDVVIISGEIGVAKPVPAIFRYACDAVGVTAAEAVHVGDRLDFDAIGARDAGLYGVWLDRAGSGGAVPRGVDVIGSLSELPELIVTISARPRAGRP